MGDGVLGDAHHAQTQLRKLLQDGSIGSGRLDITLENIRTDSDAHSLSHQRHRQRGKAVARASTEDDRPVEKVIRRTYENRITLVMKYEGSRSGYGREIVVPDQTPKIEAGLNAL